jgi:NDP-sugar pyrophosphorylase family protein
MKAVILAGGKGTRLAPYTRVLPKPLTPIGDLPILEVILRQIKYAGIKDITLTVGHLAGLLNAFFGDGSQLGLNIDYSYEDEPLGTVGPLAFVDGLDETFLIMNGDVLTTLRIADLINFHKKNKADITIATYRREVNIDLGIVQRNGDKEVTGYIEKPTYDYYVSMGIYVFEPNVLEHIPKGRHYDFPDLVREMIKIDKRVFSYDFDGYWQDLGRPDDYTIATQDFDRMRREFLPGGD